MSGRENDCWAWRSPKKPHVHLLSLVCCILTLGFCSEPASAGSESFAAMVHLEVSSESKSKAGSGFVVAIKGDSAYVVTANHVVSGRADQLNIEARFFTDMLRPRRQVKVVDQDVPNDLALLRIWPVPRGTQALSLARSLASSGAEAVLIGFPLGSRAPTPTYGQVSVARGSRLRVDASADEGNSGGPMLSGGYVQGVVVEVGHLVEVVPSPIVSLLVNSVVSHSFQASEREQTSTFPSVSGHTFENRNRGGCQVIYQSGALRSIRVTPSSKSSHAFTIREGSQIQVLRRRAAEGRTWLQIQTPDGRLGWLPADQVDGC